MCRGYLHFPLPHCFAGEEEGPREASRLVQTLDENPQPLKLSDALMLTKLGAQEQLLIAQESILDGGAFGSTRMTRGDPVKCE